MEKRCSRPLGPSQRCTLYIEAARGVLWFLGASIGVYIVSSPAFGVQRLDVQACREVQNRDWNSY